MNPRRRSALRLIANVPELNVTHKHNNKDAAQTIALIVGAAAKAADSPPLRRAKNVRASFRSLFNSRRFRL